MRMRLPSSRGSFRIRFSVFDVFWAAVSPLLALYIRDAQILSQEGMVSVALYCGISVVLSLIAFLAFRLRDGMARFLSVHDTLNVVKAVAVASLLTGVLLFTFTRLEGIPRSTPLIHAMILAAGLIAARALVHMVHTESSGHVSRNFGNGSRNLGAVEHIVMIGSTRLSALYKELLEAYQPGQRKVIAVLDDETRLMGRAMGGVSIIAPPQHLQAVIDEFAIHGIAVNRVVVGGDEDLLSEEVLKEIRRVCTQREINLDFVPNLVGLSALNAPRPDTALRPVESSPPPLTLPAYFRLKYVLDFIAALVVIVVLLPLLLLVSGLVLIDVGSPVFFWQQRAGQRGRTFLLHKFRTLRAPFDWYGTQVAEEQRISWIGHLLRETRLDELPQLLNVLVGDMSLIGPRPLLPRDQPADPSIRLMVRPGITGWAQVNGGTLLTPDEKVGLDEWYIRNASFWFDLRITFLTLKIFLRRAGRFERALNRMPANFNGSSNGGIDERDDRQPGNQAESKTTSISSARNLRASSRSYGAKDEPVRRRMPL